jgi:sugar phosphate isomerase/epimerase
MTLLTRRNVLGLLAGATPLAGVLGTLGATAAETAGGSRLGVCKDSCGIAWGAARDNHPRAPFKDLPGFLEYCHRRGAGGIQIGLGAGPPDDLAAIRAKADAYGMFVEGQVGLPRQRADLDRFEAEVRAARLAGADVLRTVMPGGRRYETFDSALAFRRFVEQSWQCLALCEPVVRKHRVRLAVENHKDFRSGELLDLLKRLGSPSVGVCVDTGNSIALLEEPMAVVEAYAPWAVSVHLKDMAVAPCDDGFLLSEVPLGEGILDLKRMVDTLRRAAPKVRFTLEMITRDPLRIPCLTPKYWAAMEEVSGSRLAQTLTMVRAKAAKTPLPRVAGLSLEEKLDREDENIRKCLGFARSRLNL